MKLLLRSLYPLHVVTAWLGNTEKVASKHYLQVTDSQETEQPSEVTSQVTIIPTVSELAEVPPRGVLNRIRNCFMCNDLGKTIFPKVAPKGYPVPAFDSWFETPFR